MTPTQAIESIGHLTVDLQTHFNAVAADVRRVVADWEGLTRVGGGRDDHAAALLVILRPSLDRLAAYCRRCSEQITAAELDPFGRNQAA